VALAISSGRGCDLAGTATQGQPAARPQRARHRAAIGRGGLPGQHQQLRLCRIQPEREFARAQPRIHRIAEQAEGLAGTADQQRRLAAFDPEIAPALVKTP
jgi:hypothetical protein